jgi:hypothetical protein
MNRTPDRIVPVWRLIRSRLADPRKRLPCGHGKAGDEYVIRRTEAGVVC